MSVMLPADLLLDRSMMGLSLSLADLALAETEEEFVAVLAAFHDVVQSVREPFAEMRHLGEALEDSLANASVAELRQLLDNLLEIEQDIASVAAVMDRYLRNARVIGILSATDGATLSLARRMLADMQNEYAPLVRDQRSRTICFIAERACAAGVAVMDCSEDFPAIFQAASMQETGGWQETAWLLADIDGARRLSESIASCSADRTEDLGKLAVFDSLAH